MVSAFLTGLCDVSPVTAFDALHVGKKLLATLGHSHLVFLGCRLLGRRLSVLRAPSRSVLGALLDDGYPTASSIIHLCGA